MKKELLIVLSDIKAVAIECGGCHSQIRLAIAAQVQLGAIGLSKCPICNTPFDSSLTANIENLRSNLQAVTSRTKVFLQFDSDTVAAKDDDN